ncbi:MAG: indolepyruvate ferredoxin oxidoreductase subunit alpha [Dethiobacteria bacterium]|nr:4Fe-4S binding protein [Bacillota bacterium]
MRGEDILSRVVNTEITADLLINQDWCKGCGICIAFCPREALFLDEKGKAEKNNEKCTCCGICETFCPDFALTVVKRRLSADGGDKAGFNARQ